MARAHVTWNCTCSKRLLGVLLFSREDCRIMSDEKAELDVPRNLCLFKVDSEEIARFWWKLTQSTLNLTEDQLVKEFGSHAIQQRLCAKSNLLFPLSLRKLQWCLQALNEKWFDSDASYIPTEWWKRFQAHLLAALEDPDNVKDLVIDGISLRTWITNLLEWEDGTISVEDAQTFYKDLDDALQVPPANFFFRKRIPSYHPFFFVTNLPGEHFFLFGDTQAAGEKEFRSLSQWEGKTDTQGHLIWALLRIFSSHNLTSQSTLSSEKWNAFYSRFRFVARNEKEGGSSSVTLTTNGFGEETKGLPIQCYCLQNGSDEAVEILKKEIASREWKDVLVMFVEDQMEMVVDLLMSPVTKWSSQIVLLTADSISTWKRIRWNAEEREWACFFEGTLLGESTKFCSCFSTASSLLDYLIK